MRGRAASGGTSGEESAPYSSATPSTTPATDSAAASPTISASTCLAGAHGTQTAISRRRSSSPVRSAITIPHRPTSATSAETPSRRARRARWPPTARAAQHRQDGEQRLPAIVVDEPLTWKTAARASRPTRNAVMLSGGQVPAAGFVGRHGSGRHAHPALPIQMDRLQPGQRHVHRLIDERAGAAQDPDNAKGFVVVPCRFGVTQLR